MRKALYILGQLTDSDVEWLARHGQRQHLRDGDVIVREGRAVDALFITLAGQLRVTLANGHEVARLRAGEIVGEIAFVDASPPSATVTAIGNAGVLALRKSVLQDRFAADSAFAARFYRALAIFLADRLRATTRRLGYGASGDLDTDEVLEDELDTGVLDSISQAGDRFTRLLQTLDAG
ncbi:MAG TPA: cyclic nucleotide-binding domain-containing protein [Stellaceae bacterium]|jgi:CRP-like cAMP-binding protein|nr:cyclic nucleotide-binding domain-containing protein [Stellaceae bacterium]